MQTMIAYPKVTVIRAYGSFNASSAAEFQRQLKIAVAADDCTVILVDMEHVESIDSDGLMVLVQSLKLVEGWGKRFSLCSFSPALRIIFELTQLDSVFEIFESAAAFEAALAHSEVATTHSYYSKQNMCA
ncbi:anti-anti-sigma factor [Gloeocapsopsis sp. AAB1 = 1H9]|uniref:Anti-sigma factor antagonist n=2 Tax=Gloeocapsopsis TaxID=693222 RepID=A0A6N8FWW1_9CHRO|nr:anti-anti-sigma factor [Gloeocapsopsis dulcis AAB1 = 1H9]